MMQRFARLTKYARRQARVLAGIFVVSLLSAVFAAALPWPLKLLVDDALGGSAATMGDGWLSGLDAATLVGVAAAAAFVLYLVGSALDLAITWAWGAAGQRMVFDLARDLFDRLQRLSLLFHSRNAVGDSLNRIMNDTYCVYTITDVLFITPIHRLFTVAIVAVVAWQLDPVLTMVLLLATPFFTGISIYIGPKIKARAQRVQAARSQLSAFVHQVLSAVPVVQAYCAEGRNREHYARLAREAVAANRSAAVIRESYSLVNGLASTICLAIVIYLGGRAALAGTMTVGSLLVFLQYSRTIQSSFRQLLQCYSKLKTAEASLERVLEVLDSEQHLAEPAHPRGLSCVAGRVRGRVEFDHVTFGYDAGLPVVKDVCLTVEPGETIALVGTTGAGKTTLVSMVPRFFDPQRGAVRIDGVDVREVGLSELRRHIAMVLQQPFLMPTSIAQNIAYGRPEASREEIMEAARAANAEAFISQLPHGLDTVIGERGATLSGGERQRIAIARAVINDASIVILDEPTSALDGPSEMVVLDAIERLREGRTMFVIAHRLSTARRASRIVVMEDGRVEEVGSHAELVHAGGRYGRLCRLQMLEVDEVTL
jgi:ATP-binding cassette subfamily B protein/subfamily B ATP-binding cassette protein MsbA